MTTNNRNHFSFELLFAVGLILLGSQAHAAVAPERPPLRPMFSDVSNFAKESTDALLQNSRSQSDKDLAAIKAELSRETNERLAAVTFDLEINSEAVDVAPEATRVAAARGDD
jgi:hypothetical protein